MKTLEALIVDNEDWLVDRVVHYAVVQGFSENTSTLREAWRSSICGLSGPILEAIAAADTLTNSDVGFGEAREKIVGFGVEQAMRHRERGVQLVDFLGLLKYYRRAYLDLIDENPIEVIDGRRLRGYVLEFFDQVEMGLCSEWHVASNVDRLRALQEQNKRLTNEKNKYLTIFESIREPVILLDAEDRPNHLNHAALRLFCGDEAPGASYYGALMSPLLNSQIAAILKGTSEGSYDTVIETLSGPREFNVNTQKMLDVSRKFDGMVIILNDVSEYKRALRRAQAADHAKSTFLATMSHEIRTPIAGVLGLARLLRDTGLSEQQARNVEGIISSGELLAGVVGDILDFSQAEVGGHAAVREDFDLAALVRQVLMVVERPAVEKGLKLDTSIDPELPARLQGDTSMIRQVLLNLVHNAIKFTETGAVTVRVSPLASADGATGRFRFEVADTGVGLPDGPTDWLFDPFTQNDRRGDSLKGGVGLGLAICRKFVSRMQGEIRCRPNPGGGSLFQIDLPLDPAQSDASIAEGPTPVASCGARILVVDDDEVNREIAQGYLARLGHEAVAVDSAEHALRCLERQGFDLVLSDNRMPGVSGLELVERIRAMPHGPNSDIPIVIVTASANDLLAGAAGQVRPDDVLAKPYDGNDLSRVISRQVPDKGRARARAHRPGKDAQTLGLLRKHLSHLGPERSLRIVQTFLDTAPGRLETLRTGVAGGDRKVVSSAAHALAGASGLLGMTEIAAHARDIEAVADDPSQTVGTVKLTVLETQLANACQDLIEFCSQSAAG